MILRPKSARSRLAVLAVAASLSLSACASQTAYDPGLSPAQNQLRQSNARFNQTIAEGAGAGALIGGLAGLALGGRNRGQAALIGAGAGAALGAGAGYLVARNNLSRSSTETEFRSAIQQAGSEAETYRRSAALSRQVADDADADARRLRVQMQAGQISRDQYRAGLQKYQVDLDSMNKQSQAARETQVNLRQNASVASGADRAQFTRLSSDVAASEQQTQSAASRLSRLLAAS